jgi:hypothetical protein
MYQYYRGGQVVESMEKQEQWMREGRLPEIPTGIYHMLERRVLILH